MSDWWSRVLGDDGPPPARREGTPPTTTPQWQPQPPAAPQPNWAGAGGSGAAPIQPQFHQGYIPKEEQALDENEFFAALNGMLAVETTGDKAAQDVKTGVIEDQCPQCHSRNYFSRRYAENGTLLRNPPAPQCHDCGYPLVQSGSVGGALRVATASKGATPAHQPAQNPDYIPRNR